MSLKTSLKPNSEQPRQHHQRNMTKVTIDNTSYIHSFLCVGHAGYAEHGQDIVCASASILAYTLIQAIQNMAVDGKLVGIDNVSAQGGRASISCIPKDEHKQEVFDIFSTVQVGYELLAQQYPQYVELNVID